LAVVQPFLGIRYNQKLIKEMGSVMCPPHDVIPQQMQEELYHRNEYNFIRIEFGRELPDNQEDNRYTRAAATLKQWLEKGVLAAETQPAIYIHDYYFTYHGKSFKRRGLIARVRLEEWSKGIIFPHEGTLSKSKGDRLSILWACEANTSPILAMFQDNNNLVLSTVNRESRKKPLIETASEGGEKHVVWAITDPAVTCSICTALAPQPLYIADGHHRYESALMYKHERESCAPSTGSEGYNFVMMTLIEFNDPGLLILPPHRLVRGVSKNAIADLKEGLAAFFNFTELSTRDRNVWQQVDGLLTGGLEHVRLGMYGLDAERLYILELKEGSPTDSLMPAFHTDIYKRLDVSIVDHVILEKLLNLGSQGEQATLAYTYDKQDAVTRVRENEFQLALLLSPVKAEVIKAIADTGDRMPRKSTYFYPKEPAGLVFNRLTG
jgi:uncharacterized protein (DUF1015 family)